MLGVVTACELEAALIRRRMRLRREMPAAVGRLWSGHIAGVRVGLVRCGMGPARAAAAAFWLIQTYHPWGLLNAGFAGGLHPSLDTGDALIAQQILWGAVDREEETPAAFEALRPDAKLAAVAAAAATGAALPLRCGALLSVPEVMAGAAAKVSLGARAGALATDMESYRLGRVAAAHGLPFVVLRTIFDTCDDEVPPRLSRCITVEGTLHYGRLACAGVLQPRVLISMPSLWRKARLAGRCLDLWLQGLFARLGQEGREEGSP